MNTSLFFDGYFKRARINSMLIMECDGTILKVNQGFSDNYGYSEEDLAGTNYSRLFSNLDIESGKPAIELQNVTRTGQSNDENYVMHKDGAAVWSTGESLLVESVEGLNYIVKDIVNLHSKKQLQIILMETEALLETVLATSRQIPMVILNGSMKIQSANNAFVSYFELDAPPVQGTRIADLNNSFWNSSEIKKSLTASFITNQPIKNQKCVLEANGKEAKTFLLNSKIIDTGVETGRKFFIIIDDLSS